jgi:hypothetical protein
MRMRKKMIRTAEFQVGDILPMVLIMAVAGIGIAYTLNIQGDISDDIGKNTCEKNIGGHNHTMYNESANNCYNASGHHMEVPSVAFNASRDSIEASAKFSSKFGLIATVIIAAILIGILVRYLNVSGSQ